MTYCPHCNEFIPDAFIDYSFSDSTYSDDYEMDEVMEDFGHVPISRGLKRTREEAGLGDMQDSRPTKKRLSQSSASWGGITLTPMEVDQ